MSDRGKSSESKTRSGGQDRQRGAHVGTTGPWILQRFQTNQTTSLRLGTVHPSIGDRRGSGIGATDHRRGDGGGPDAARLHPGGNAVPGSKRFHPAVLNCSASGRETFAGVA